MLGKIKACTYGVAFVACQFLASYEKKSKIQLHYNADGSDRAARAIAYHVEFINPSVSIYKNE